MDNSPNTAETEIWKPVVGYETGYRVSSLGRVRSIDKWVNSKNGSFALKRGQMLTPHRSKRSGYIMVGLYRDGQSKTTCIHRLVCLAFAPEGAGDGMQVAHNDGSRDNNRLENLRWDSAKGNSLDRLKHGTQQMGEKQHLAKLTESDVLEIRAEYTGKYGDLKRLGKRFGVTSTQILHIVKRLHWKHI